MNSTQDKSLTILVAEDDEFLREIVALNLLKRGFQILTASEGREAFQVVQENPRVELVISDIQMPGRTGMELLRDIQTLNSKAPKVILMTGYADVTSKDAMEAGADAMITKPFQTEALLQLINGLFPALNCDK